jgi:hypothetical protein
MTKVFNETLKPCVVLLVVYARLLQLPYYQILLTYPLQVKMYLQGKLEQPNAFHEH